MEDEQRQAAKEHMIALMQAGHSWQEAATRAGIQTSRLAAYRLLQNARTRGKAAFQDGRHGHPAKLRDTVLQWLVATCRAHPQMPSCEVQAALQEQFGISVSVGHLNRVRTQWGMGKRVGCQKKNGTSSLLHWKLSGKRVLVPYCWSRQRKRQD